MTTVYDAPDAAGVLSYGEVQAYAQVAMTTLTIWNYFTHLGQEVELIWMRDWTRMTLLYVMLRYGGLLYALDQLMLNIYNTPAQASDELCMVWYILGNVLEMVMCTLVGTMLVIRVNALMGKPRRLGWFLWTYLVAAQSFAIATTVLLDDPKAGFDVWSTLIDGRISTCSSRVATSRLWVAQTNYGMLLAFQLLLTALSIYRFQVHVTEARTLDRRVSRCCMRSTDTFLGLLVRDHVLSFLTVLLEGILHATTVRLHLPSHGTSAAILSIITVFLNMVVRTLVGPYLFLSVRKFDAMRSRTLKLEEIALSVMMFADATHVDLDEDADRALGEAVAVCTSRVIAVRVSKDVVPDTGTRKSLHR